MRDTDAGRLDQLETTLQEVKSRHLNTHQGELPLEPLGGSAPELALG